MKIPYVVSSNTREAYRTTNVMKNSVAELPRKILAEDFEWDDDLTPAPLTYFAALTLSKVFHRINPLHRILQKDVDMLMDLYPATIPLKYSVPHIKDEQYWKRSYATKFPDRKELGISYWKGKFLSTCLQDYLEKVNPDVFIEEDAVELATLVSPYIYELGLSQLQMVRQPNPPVPYENVVEDTCIYSVPKLYDHIPLEPVLMKLYNLQEISLVFGINNVAEGYLPRYFEFSMGDCESLCRGLEDLRHLRLFRINRSNLDCSKVKLILQNLVKKESIEELDFNHCKIGDYGMKALGGFIYIHNNVKVVRIANNRFKEVGVQGIAYALQMKPAAPIELIDFSLNPMSLECATIFAAAFVRCKEKPQTLIVNSCGFSGASAEKMAGLLSLNRGLTRLDMAANDLSGEAEETLIRALEQNKKVLRIDLRRTHISEATQAKVDELLERNKKLIGQEIEPSDEIPPLYLNEPEYLIWEYNPNNPDYIPGRYPTRVPEV
ncbi:dynein regulatory complex subunit 5-like [Plodia interpunctella]|uniref:dynein regulatory complex subunit 5-like n=1 Tax=Plodia interpunctella TaxID=58824 RepID=UPI0023678E5E|nr:dynein regulatory complex subunit 5-like [Plodia interpunctella]XP_053615692.1 dynein regulatory complex subunit 5-like [Plodia interpunctella]